MVSIKLYVEGGGDSKPLKTACREGFRTFIEKAGLSGRMPRIIACGGRDIAYDKFKIAHVNQDGTSLLLVDSERPVDQAGPWEHLEGAPDEWSRPDGASDDQCHLMVQIMESWFLADRDALEEFYGQGYRENALPQNPQVEQITKRDVLNGLDRAAEKPQKVAMTRERTASRFWRNWTRRKSRAPLPMRNALSRPFFNLRKASPLYRPHPE